MRAVRCPSSPHPPSSLRSYTSEVAVVESVIIDVVEDTGDEETTR